MNKSLTLKLLFIHCLLMYLAALGAHGRDDAGITLSLDNADIADLILWASDVTDKNIILHPNVQGRVTVIAGEPMSEQDAYDVFLSVLQVHGLGVVEEGGSLKVIPDNLARESAIPLMNDTSESPGEEIVIRIVRVRHISAADVISLLKPLLPQTGYLAAYPQTNTMVVADRAGNIRKLLAIIERIDQAGTIDIELISIEHADAQEITAVLDKLLARQGSGAERGGDNFTLAVDERSNSILMTGDPVTRQQVRLLINRLDKPLPGDGNTQVIRVQYATATELVPLLQNITGSVQKGIKDQGLASIDVSIDSHDQLNALILTAPPTLLATLRGVIAQLDTPRSQVLVEALIVEVSEDLSNKIGIEWRTRPVADGSVGGFTSSPGDITLLDLNDEGSLELGTGLSLGYLRGGSLRGIVNMLSSETNANILSTPTVVSLDNEEAEILVGSNVPFITGSQQRAGDIDPFQTIQRQDIGVTLKVTPRINNNNSVTLEIEQSVESIAQSTVSTADIVTNKREIKTRVLIPDDRILVLGGLMRDELSDGENRVPVLGSIPLLGNLFKSKSTKLTKTNLMIFIHPRILHEPGSYIDISSEKYNRLRDRQQHFDSRVERFWIPGKAPQLPALEELKEGNE